MQTHGDAVEYLRARSVAATRREWALGDTVVVPIGAGTTGPEGITVYHGVMWLVPREAGWDVVQPVQSRERRIHFGSLSEACETVLALLPLYDLHEDCSVCGARRGWSFGERVMVDGLRWFVSRSCAECGYCTEADGRDSLPEDLRAIELARSGSWCVRLRSVTSVHGWKAVREALALDLQALATLRRELPCDVFTGTCAESLRVLNRMGMADIVAELACQGRDDHREKRSDDPRRSGSAPQA